MASVLLGPSKVEGVMQVLDWARAMPSLIIGQNRVPQGQPGVTDDGWRRWTHDAISKLMAQYSRPLGTLPHQIMACLKQAHYSLGAGSFDGDGCTGFGLPGGLQGGPQQLQGAVAPATPLPLYDAQSPMANDQLLAHYHAEGKSPHFGQSRPYPGYPQPGLPHSSNFSDALGGVLGPRGSRKDETDPSKSLQASGGPRRSMRCRTSRDHDEPRPGHHSRSISELSTKTLAGLEPPEFPGLLMHEAMLRGQPADEVSSHCLVPSFDDFCQIIRETEVSALFPETLEGMLGVPWLAHRCCLNTQSGGKWADCKAIATLSAG